MKRLFIILLLSVSVFTVSAQKVYFVYIQSENDFPFFIKMEDNIYNSTGSGYLILSKLKDTSYNFRMGFPQDKWPEQKFRIAINSRDHGFILKNIANKGWALFDLQTGELLISSAKKDSLIKDEVINGNNDKGFSDMLAKATGDPSIRENNDNRHLKQIEKKEVKITVSNTPDTLVARKEVSKEVKKVEKAVVADTGVVTKPAIINENDSVTVTKKDNRDLKQIEQKEVMDTVSILPDTLVARKEVTKEVKKVEKPVVADTGVVTKPVIISENDSVMVTKKDREDTQEIKEVRTSTEAGTDSTHTFKKSIVIKKSESSTTEGFGLIFIDKYPGGLADTIKILIPEIRQAVVKEKDKPKREVKFIEMGKDSSQGDQKEKKIVNDTLNKQDEKKFGTNCTTAASENDFFELRKNMASIQGDEKMIAEATEYFKKKCFLTEQIRNLGSLFLTDEGKYRFFDAAYKFVIDPIVYNELQSELKDEYYINRFKAMLR